MTATATHHRRIPDRLNSPFQRIAGSWETLLLGVALTIFVANSLASPYFLDAWNLSDATFNFTEKAMIAFPMALLIISGEIDLSVAAIIALASTAMGAAVQFGAGTTEIVLIGLAVGLLRGAFNGLLVTRLGLPSIVVTIGTMSLFRGIAYIVLGDKAYTGYPPGFAYFGQGYVWWVFFSSWCSSRSWRSPMACSCTRPISGGRSTRSATTRPRRSSRASASRG